MHKVTNLDMDEQAIKFSDKLNGFNTYKGIADNTHNFDDYDLVINASSEHMTEDWFKKLKKVNWRCNQTISMIY